MMATPPRSSSYMKTMQDMHTPPITGTQVATTTVKLEFKQEPIPGPSSYPSLFVPDGCGPHPFKTRLTFAFSIHEGRHRWTEPTDFYRPDPGLFLSIQRTPNPKISIITDQGLVCAEIYTGPFTVMRTIDNDFLKAPFVVQIKMESVTHILQFGDEDEAIRAFKVIKWIKATAKYKKTDQAVQQRERRSSLDK